VQPVAALVRSVVINRVDGRKWRATADARVLAEVVAGSVGVAAGSPVVVEVAAAVAVAAAEVEEVVAAVAAVVEEVVAADAGEGLTSDSLSTTAFRKH